MSTKKKLLQKFFSEKPSVDITWRDLVVVASIFECEPIQKSRHRAIVHKGDPTWVYMIPVHSDGEPIKRAYISELREMFREIDPEVINDEI